MKTVTLLLFCLATLFACGKTDTGKPVTLTPSANTTSTNTGSSAASANASSSTGNSSGTSTGTSTGTSSGTASGPVIVNDSLTYLALGDSYTIGQSDP
jgi:hypothetical protein